MCMSSMRVLVWFITQAPTFGSSTQSKGESQKPKDFVFGQGYPLKPSTLKVMRVWGLGPQESVRCRKNLQCSVCLRARIPDARKLKGFEALNLGLLKGGYIGFRVLGLGSYLLKGSYVWDLAAIA